MVMAKRTCTTISNTLMRRATVRVLAKIKRTLGPRRVGSSLSSSYSISTNSGAT
jgi:hypothetical protein